MKKKKITEKECSIHYEHIVSANSEWQLHRAFDILFQEVMKAKRNKKTK